MFKLITFAVVVAACASLVACDDDKKVTTYVPKLPSLIPPPPPMSPESMVSIPEGRAIDVGQRDGSKPSSIPARTPAFTIDRNVVSCDDYRACPTCPHLNNACDVDVAVVPYEAAAAYCAARGAELPSIYEWRRAVMGSAGHLFPTGDSYDEAKACLHPTRDPVFPEDDLVRCGHASADGVAYFIRDRNGLEWTRSLDSARDARQSADRHAGVLLMITPLGRPIVPRTGSSTGEFRCARAVK